MENISYLRILQALITGIVLVLVILQDRWWWLRVPGSCVGIVLLIFCTFQLIFRSNHGFSLVVLYAATAFIVSLIAIASTVYRFLGEKTLVLSSLEILSAIILTIVFTGFSSDFIFGLLLKIQGTRTIP